MTHPSLHICTFFVIWMTGVTAECRPCLTLAVRFPRTLWSTAAKILLALFQWRCLFNIFLILFSMFNHTIFYIFTIISNHTKYTELSHFPVNLSHLEWDAVPSGLWSWCLVINVSFDFIGWIIFDIWRGVNCLAAAVTSVCSGLFLLITKSILSKILRFLDKPQWCLTEHSIFPWKNPEPKLSHWWTSPRALSTWSLPCSKACHWTRSKT